ncbi:hypothetical protein ACG9XW_10755 [Acinetobacter guillouiae]|uniref:hypothetical protein n=1 Tax=Acinetobacter guillouiae TaxID=106649 RepID=UPI003AF80D29
MKKLLQGAVLPFVIFISGMLLLGCNQAAEQSRQQDDAQAIETAQMSENTSDSNNNNQSTAKSTENLKQGNMFYIARDVANVQLKTGDYVEKLQQSQANLQQAIQSQNQAELQQSVKTLTRELQGFNTALISLDLKSQEIDGIRQQVLQANKQVLNSALLNGDLDISKVDFKKIEQQMNTIQLDMLKLAGMMIPLSNTEQAT